MPINRLLKSLVCAAKRPFILNKAKIKKYSVTMVALFFGVGLNNAFLLLFFVGHATRSSKPKGNVTKLGTDKAD